MLDLNDVPSLAGHAVRAVGLLIRAKREGMRLYIDDRGTVIVEVNKADPSMTGPPEWIVDCGIPEEHVRLAIPRSSDHSRDLPGQPEIPGAPRLARGPGPAEVRGLHQDLRGSRAMTPRRGFLQALGVATLAVALDVLPALGFKRPSVDPPADEHYLEWHEDGLWICSETVTALQPLGDRLIVMTPTRTYSIANEMFFSPTHFSGRVLTNLPILRPVYGDARLAELAPPRSAGPSPREASR